MRVLTSFAAFVMSAAPAALSFGQVPLQPATGCAGDQPDIGACCFATGGCAVVTQTFCTTHNGVYQGNGTYCAPNPCGGPTQVSTLFVGLQYGGLPTRRTDLSGFPNVIWTSGFVFELNGAAGRPDGAVYLSSGDFNTKLYLAPLPGPVMFLTNIDKDMSALAYGRNKLWGFSNYSSPMGIYEINPATGVTTLAVGTAAQGYRFFALDYNVLDGLLYGYTEYGTPTGLYAIDPDTGLMTFLAPPPPNVNGQGRAMACGRNTVFLLATRGADQEPVFAYDLAQGPGGAWVPFTQPYPQSNATGGAAWAPRPVQPGDLDCDGDIDFGDINPFVQILSDPLGWLGAYPNCNYLNGDCSGDGLVNFGDINPFVALLSGT